MTEKDLKMFNNLDHRENEKNTTSRFYITQARRVKINRQTTAQTRKDGGKGEHYSWPAGSANCYNRYGNQCAKVPREAKTRSTTRSSSPALECICKGLYLTTETLAHLCLLPLCSQSPEIENSLDVQPLVNE